ncbi:MAG: hypothetical protein LBG31_00740 [Prevotellaceae bacterium]|nr:hypothetical protein [Prevotellaceae bacterium]
MRTKFFFFAMLASVAASAQSHINIEMLSATYTASPAVKFCISWSSVPTVTGQTHNAKVWVWIDFLKVNADNTTTGNTWTRAEISATPAVSSSPTSTAALDASTNKGFWLNGVTGSYSATVTAMLTNIPANTKFNWCAYSSDYPPNVTLEEGVYTFKGTTDFIVSNPARTLDTKTIAKNNLTVNPATTFTDATSCPGIGSLYCPYTGSDLYMDATHLCQQRTSGAKNWEAWIKDTRDNQLYRIVQMPTNTWWMAEDLMWDGKPNPTASGYTIRGVARSCGNHYGCGRTYNSTATGAGAYSGNANTRRNSDVCPTGWVIPSCAEFCPYATAAAPSPYLGTEEQKGPDTYGLSLWICGATNWTCGTGALVYVAGASAVDKWYTATVTIGRCDDNSEANGKRNVRCVRDL